MKKTIFLSVVSCLLLLASCSKSEYELEQTVFIPDPVYDQLPVYSEWGYNTFGAYVDREAFVSTSNYIPSKIIIHSDTLNLLLTGQIGYQKVMMNFSIKGDSYLNYPDLISLNGKTIPLDSSNCTVTLTQNDGPATTFDVFTGGELTIKRAQKLYVDGELLKVVLSGTFRFKTLYHDVPISISNGRFDLGIGFDNFYNY